MRGLGKGVDSRTGVASSNAIASSGPRVVNYQAWDWHASRNWRVSIALSIQGPLQVSVPWHMPETFRGVVKATTRLQAIGQGGSSQVRRPPKKIRSSGEMCAESGSAARASVKTHGLLPATP
jgi:hypothetical protein